MTHFTTRFRDCFWRVSILEEHFEVMFIFLFESTACNEEWTLLLCARNIWQDSNDNLDKFFYFKQSAFWIKSTFFSAKIWIFCPISRNLHHWPHLFTLCFKNIGNIELISTILTKSLILEFFIACSIFNVPNTAFR